MPLPAALAAKLAKRGLITPKQRASPAEPARKIDFKGLSTCPNKSNVFHECTVWCDTHWKGVLTPDPKYLRNAQKLMGKYPLPNSWTEIFDKGIGRYYYWNVENDLVSWLPPKHPKAVITKSAAKLRERRLQDQKDKRPREKENSNRADRQDKEYSRSDRDRDRDRERDRDRDRDSDDEDRSYRSKYSDRRDRDRDRDRDREDRRSKREREDRHRRGDKRKREDQLDPMDPAAYSDIPQGTWSDGLETNKTRADSTASGVLFQQRPYPAPGAVLAANREKEEKEKKK